MKPGEVVDKPKKRGKKGKTKHRGHFDLLRVRTALSSGFKDIPEDLRREKMEKKRKRRCNTLGERQGAEGIGFVLVKDALGGEGGLVAGTAGHENTVTVW